LNRYEESFLQTLEDLREKVASNDRYQLIKASGLLRLLLLDAMVHDANRNHKVKLKFYLTLKDYRKVKVKPLSLDEFLSTEWKAYREHTYSVKEIIETSAHLMGGVHLKKPKQKKEVDLVDIFDHRPITIDTIKSSLIGISKLTIEALAELEEQIKNN
jgi:hypothetical protein